MSTLYTTAALVKKAIGITDTDREDLVAQALESACRAIDDHCGRRFYADETATARRYRVRGRVTSDADGQLLLVDDIASVTGLAVDYGDGVTWTALDDSRWLTDPDNAAVLGRAITGLRRVSGYWTGSSHARVTAVWGWPAVPAPVAQAALLQAARLFRRKDSPQGVISTPDWGPTRVSRVDPDVQALLGPYVIPGMA